jgi:hypothetical protein
VKGEEDSVSEKNALIYCLEKVYEDPDVWSCVPGHGKESYYISIHILEP